jgi:hypothetical protein
VSKATRAQGRGDPWPNRRRRTTIWHWIWSLWCQLLVATGLACAFAHWGPSIVLPLMVILTICAATLVDITRDRGIPRLWRIVKTAVIASFTLTATAGLVVVLGALGITLALTAIGTGPMVTSWAGRRWRSSVGSLEVDDLDSTYSCAQWPDPAEQAETIRAAEELPQLDDASLCLAWRRSFVPLSQRPSVVKQMFLVEQRQAYLDEIERRSPQGLAAWLDSGARASGNPFPYLSVSPPQQN